MSVRLLLHKRTCAPVSPLKEVCASCSIGEGAYPYASSPLGEGEAQVSTSISELREGVLLVCFGFIAKA
jgi:hypothetical protein